MAAFLPSDDGHEMPSPGTWYLHIATGAAPLPDSPAPFPTLRVRRLLGTKVTVIVALNKQRVTSSTLPSE